MVLGDTPGPYQRTYAKALGMCRDPGGPQRHRSNRIVEIHRPNYASVWSDHGVFFEPIDLMEEDIESSLFLFMQVMAKIDNAIPCDICRPVLLSRHSVPGLGNTSSVESERRPGELVTVKVVG